jgi:hypothetical protein
MPPFLNSEITKSSRERKHSFTDFQLACLRVIYFYQFELEGSEDAKHLIPLKLYQIISSTDSTDLFIQKLISEKRGTKRREPAQIYDLIKRQISYGIIENNEFKTYKNGPRERNLPKLKLSDRGLEIMKEQILSHAFGLSSDEIKDLLYIGSQGNVSIKKISRNSVKKMLNRDLVSVEKRDVVLTEQGMEIYEKLKDPYVYNKAIFMAVDSDM